jgi:hypothetical protein
MSSRRKSRYAPISFKGQCFNYQNALALQVERFLLASDCRFFRDVGQSSHLGAAHDIGIQTLLPFLAVIVVESHKYFGPGWFDNEALLKQEAMLRRSRAQSKLLDGTRLVDEFMDAVDENRRLHLESFMSMHQGFFRFVSRLIQTDMGIYFLGDQFITTTHILSLNYGLTNDDFRTHPLASRDLGKQMYEVAIDMGRK